VLETKWYLSEQEGNDVGLLRAIEAYLDLGAPAPETTADAPESAVALDLERLSNEDFGET
jgi:hypothetical protein